MQIGFQPSLPWPSREGWAIAKLKRSQKLERRKVCTPVPQSNRSAAHPVNRRSSPHCWGRHAHSGKWRHSKRSRPSRREETPKEGFPTRLLRRAPGFVRPIGADQGARCWLCGLPHGHLPCPESDRFTHLSRLRWQLMGTGRISTERTLTRVRVTRLDGDSCAACLSADLRKCQDATQGQAHRKVAQVNAHALLGSAPIARPLGA